MKISQKDWSSFEDLEEITGWEIFEKISSYKEVFFKKEDEYFSYISFTDEIKKVDREYIDQLLNEAK